MTDRIPVTRAGYERKLAELKQMEEVDEPVFIKRVADARSEGDLSENAEYHGARESLGMLQAKINYLRDQVSRMEIVDTSKLPKDEIAFGATITFKDIDYGDEETYTLVGAGDEDYDNGRILVTSPLAQGLLGKKVGEVAEIEVPAGLTRLKILEIQYED